MKKIAINTANLHTGGGVQVATSFIYDLSFIKSKHNFSITLLLSKEIHKNLISLGFNDAVFEKIKTYDVNGFNALFSIKTTDLNFFDLVFTVFGPHYSFFNKYINIVGFAQPWIIYPNNEIYIQQSKMKKIVTKAKFYVQKYFFKKSDRLIVELEHAKVGLQKNLRYSNSQIDVVYNTFSPAFNIFLDKDIPNLTRDKEVYTIGYLSRDYPHKNLSILPIVKMILEQEYSIITNFLVTLTDVEWGNKSPKFQNEITNVGALTVSECPAFYQKLDAVVFPSLLECFSATPLETMISGIPLFASDRPFVKDVCKEHAHYIDPLCPGDIAQKIASYIALDINEKRTKLICAKNFAASFSRSKDRTDKYLDIINNCLTELSE
jgi:glycosyltransferase involved in cell wall biosynthesis